MHRHRMDGRVTAQYIPTESRGDHVLDLDLYARHVVFRCEFRAQRRGVQPEHELRVCRPFRHRKPHAEPATNRGFHIQKGCHGSCRVEIWINKRH